MTGVCAFGCGGPGLGRRGRSQCLGSFSMFRCVCGGYRACLVGRSRGLVSPV